MAVTTTAAGRAPVASQRQQLIKVPGFDGYFRTKTGGRVSADVTKVTDGGELQPDVMAGNPTTDNITVTKLYRPSVHAAQLADLDRRVGAWRTNLSITDTDADLIPLTGRGATRSYPNALLVGLAWPEGDAEASDPATFELEFAVPGLARG